MRCRELIGGGEVGVADVVHILRDRVIKSDGNGRNLGMVQFWVAASSAAWGWQNLQSGATIPKSFGFEAATPCETTNKVLTHDIGKG